MSESRFLSIGRLKKNVEWRMSAHAHPFNQMIFVMQGAQWVEMAGQTIKAEENDFLFYPKRVAYAEWTEPGNDGMAHG